MEEGKEDSLRKFEESDSEDEFEGLIEDAAKANVNIARRENVVFVLQRLELLKQYLNVSAMILGVIAFCSLVFYELNRHYSYSQHPIDDINSMYTPVDISKSKNFDIDKIIHDAPKIVVLGERNSGMMELASQLSSCYPDFEVVTSFGRHGYWFQSEDLSKMVVHHAIVIATYLNVYDWVDLMRQNPIHASHHKNMNWRAFVESEWTMPRREQDIGHQSEQGRICQQQFEYSQINPCKLLPGDTGQYPVYEQKQNGKGPFNSILSLRNEKIHNHISMISWDNVDLFLPVKYEEIMQLGLGDVFDQIQQATGYHPICANVAGLNLGFSTHTPTLKYDPKYIEWIDQHVDWKAERLIGYEAGEMMSSAQKNRLSKGINEDTQHEVVDLTSPTIEDMLNTISSGSAAAAAAKKPDIEEVTSPYDGIKRVAIIGERNSGVTWLYSRLVNCFPQVEVTDSLVRESFLFQSPPQSLGGETLVIALFVHPYTWVELMRRYPQNAPSHSSLKWDDFVTSSWTMTTEQIKPVSHPCQFNFTYLEVVPCKPRKTFFTEQAIYELRSDGSGVPYSSILGLRADKIRNHLSTAKWQNVNTFLTVNYESLMREGFFQQLLHSITADTGLHSWCDVSKNTDFTAPSLSVKDDYDANIEYVEWMDEHLDWSAERLVGYDLDLV